MIYTGSDVTISIDSVEYTGSIYELNESGGDITYTTVRTYGNNYTQVPTGRTNYSLELSFKMLDTTVETLFKTSSAMQIAVAVGGSFTVTYSNAKPINLNIEAEVEDMIAGIITFDVPPLDSSGTDNRSIV